MNPYQCLVVNLLPDELVLAERIACLSCDGVDRAFLHLLFDGAEEREERFAGTFLHSQREGHICREERSFTLIKAKPVFVSETSETIELTVSYYLHQGGCVFCLFV